MTGVVVTGSIAAALELRSPPPPFLPKATSAASATETRFDPGAFRRGGKALNWSTTSPLTLSVSGEVVATIGCRAKTSAGWIDWLRTPDAAADASAGRVVGTAAFALNKAGDRATFNQGVQLDADGKIGISWSYRCPLEKAADLTEFMPSIEIPRTAAAGRTLVLGDKALVIPDDAAWARDWHWINMGAQTAASCVAFNPQHPGKGFKIELPRPLSIMIFRSPDGVYITFRNEFHKPEGQMEMRLDLAPADEESTAGDSIVAGINFTQADNLDVAVYTGSKNLFMNPAFASGTRYFTQTAFLRRFSDIGGAVVDCDEPFGRQAFHLSKEGVAGITSFGIPLHADEPYTVSFFAKPDGAGQATVALMVGSYDRLPDIHKTFSIPPGVWTRCEATVSVPRRQAMFGWSSTGALISGLQLEPGGKATAYCGNPFGMEVLVDSPDGMVCEAGKPVNARLRFRGPRGGKGTATVSVTDFFYREIFSQTFTWSIPESGEVSIPLALDGVLPIGPAVVKVDLRSDGGPAYRDNFRLVSMKTVSNDFKQKRIHSFCKYGYNTILSDVPDEELDLFRKCGFGLHTYHAFLAKPDVREFDRFAQRGIGIASISPWGMIPAVVASEGRTDGRLNLPKGELLDGKFSLDARQIDEVAPAFEAALEEASRKLGAEFPFVPFWMGHSEPDAGSKLVQTGRYEEFAKIQTAMCRGIKRGNPKAKFVFGGACNMAKQGRDTTIAIVAACRKIAPDLTFDGVEIHTYRNFPEQPDTDEELKQFLLALEAQGYDDTFPVYLNEGAYFYPLNVPEWMGIAPWSSTTASKDRYAKMHTPTYDMGWAERLGAAMTMRYWLVCYKYMDRIHSATPWGVYLLDGRTPYAWITVSSALADILGDSTFKRDIRFAPGARAYVFEDRERRPVAAVWSFGENVERGREQPPRMTAAFAGMAAEFLDMYGNPRKVEKDADGRHDLPLSNFPFFIRGQVGDLEALCAGLESAAVQNAGKLPLELAAKPVSRHEVGVEVLNPLTRPFNGTIAINDGAEQKLELAPRTEASFSFGKTDCVPDDQIASIVIPISVAENGGAAVREQFSFRAFAVNYRAPGAIRIDGAADDWADIPAIPLAYANTYVAHGNVPMKDPAEAGEFAASYRAAWNEGALHLLIDVVDSGFAVDRSSPKPSLWYARNAVQLFFDTLGDAPAKARANIRDYDENDYSYELLPGEDGQSAVVYRRVAPDTQLTGGVDEGLMPNRIEPGVAVAFRREGSRQVYEVAFPARYLMPMALSEGAVSGFGMMVFDHTGTKTRVNIPHGLDVAGNPQNHPAMLLVK